MFPRRCFTSFPSFPSVNSHKRFCRGRCSKACFTEGNEGNEGPIQDHLLLPVELMPGPIARARLRCSGNILVMAVIAVMTVGDPRESDTARSLAAASLRYLRSLL